MILSKLEKGHLYAFDQDEDAIKIARPRLEAIGNNFTIIKSNFVDLKEERQAVLTAVQESDDIPSGMEMFPATDEEQFNFIKNPKLIPKNPLLP